MINGHLMIAVLLNLMMIHHGDLLSRLMLMMELNQLHPRVMSFVIYVAVCSRRPII